MSSLPKICPLWLIKLYGTALYLYPKSFRENYREQMLQVFIDDYQCKQKSNSALFLFNTLSDLGGSMSQEHFSAFSQHGRIRMAIIGLCLALGLLSLRPFLTSTLTDSFTSLAKTDDKVSELVLKDYYRHSEKTAIDLLHSDDPMKIIAGARFLSEWQSESFLNAANAEAIDFKTPLNQTLDKTKNNALILIAAYPICVKNASTCNAGKVLNHLRNIAPDNGMTWLYSASEARERGDVETQNILLQRANAALFFDDANNALNARWYRAHVETPYKLPWYSGFASRNLSKLETSVMGFDNYVIPGCEDLDKAAISIKNSCLTIAKKIALQSTTSLTLKLTAASMAAKLGDTDSIAMLELLKEQNSGYYYYLYATDNRDVAALAKAYENERQYAFTAEMAAVNKQEKYPDVYAF